MKSYKKSCLAMVGMLLSLGAISVGYGATATGSLSVTATVPANCTVGAGATLAFGNYDPLSTVDNDQPGTVTVTCTNQTPYTIALNGGGSGDINARTMLGGTPNPLNYQIYTDAGRTTIWGDGTTGQTVAGTGTGGQQNITAYGRVPASQASVAPANYADTVQITVNY